MTKRFKFKFRISPLLSFFFSCSRTPKLPSKPKSPRLSIRRHVSSPLVSAACRRSDDDVTSSPRRKIHNSSSTSASGDDVVSPRRTTFKRKETTPTRRRFEVYDDVEEEGEGEGEREGLVSPRGEEKKKKKQRRKMKKKKKVRVGGGGGHVEGGHWRIPWRESMAVVKQSENPYLDFKRSMLDMIVEKDMFDDRELEQLLFCFLSLNSPNHHHLIINAFVDIWNALFS